MNLSKQIRDLRYAKGWGPDELASRAKISRTALYQIERGNTSTPQAGTLTRICRALGVPLESLLEKGPGITQVTPEPTTATVPVSPAPLPRGTLSDRTEELIEKFRLLLASPLAEGVARIVEDSYRLLPIIPASTSAESPRYPSPSEIDPARRGRSRSHNSV